MIPTILALLLASSDQAANQRNQARPAPKRELCAVRPSTEKGTFPLDRMSFFVIGIEPNSSTSYYGKVSVRKRDHTHFEITRTSGQKVVKGDAYFVKCQEGPHFLKVTYPTRPTRTEFMCSITGDYGSNARLSCGPQSGRDFRKFGVESWYEIAPDHGL